MSRRSADRWSAPVFMQLAKGSWGFQAGPEQAGGVLRPDEAMNREIYGPRATSRAILAGPRDVAAHGGQDVPECARVDDKPGDRADGLDVAASNSTQQTSHVEAGSHD